jgi:hypothetical protein
MKNEDIQRVEIFLKKWKGSQGNERANYQGFFLELCDALAVERPAPKGSIANDPYCFDKDIKIFNKDGETTNFADFYKEGHFLSTVRRIDSSAIPFGSMVCSISSPDFLLESSFCVMCHILLRVPYRIACYCLKALLSLGYG